MKNNIRQYDNEIKRMYLEGYSSTLIAEHFNVSKPGIICRLRTLGIVSNTRRKNTYSSGKCYKKYDKTIIDLYSKGLSIEAVGKALNLSRNTVYYRLKINNINLRKVKGIKHSIRKAKISIEFFKKQIEKDKSGFDYFIGIFASDGNVYNNIIRIGGISDENAEFLNHWCNFLDNKVHIHRRLRTGKNTYYNEVSFKNIDVAELMSNEYNITQNKTFTIELPYINWNIIRGLFDGDGCLTKDKRANSWKFEIVSASIKLATQMYNFFICEGLYAHIYKEGSLFTVSVLRKSDLIKIFQNLYKDCKYFLKRKYDKFLPIIQETE